MAVREVALDCLLMCRPPGRSQAITDYVLALAQLDTSMKSRAACAISESILVSLSLGEIMMESGDDASIVKTLRRELSRRPGLKEGIDNALM
jgi:transcription initiation factor TFIID subunit 2